MNIEILTPGKIVFSDVVQNVVLPSLGVLPGHAPFIIKLKKGRIEVDSNGSGKIFDIPLGAVAKIKPDNITILAEEAVPVQ